MDSENTSTYDSTLEETISNSEHANNYQIKDKLVSGEYKFIQKRGRSKVWDTFSKIEDENGEEMANVVACQTCYNIYKFTNSTSNLVKHKCYMINSGIRKSFPELEVDMLTKKKILNIISDWTVENCRLFNIIDEVGLRKLAKFLIEVGGNFGPNVDLDKLLPHPTTISSNISSLYDIHFEHVKSDILKIKELGCSMTTDIWTDNYMRTSYISCIVHYINDGVLVTRLLAIKSMKSESCTSFKVKDKISKILNEFGCDLEEDDPIIVTDKESKMVAAFRGLNHIYCVNHLMNNIIEQTMKEVPGISGLIDKCSKLVQYLDKSGFDYQSVTLKSRGPTRWNRIYYLFNSIEINWMEITSILNEKNEEYRLNDINFNTLSSLVKLLSSFEKSSTKLEGINYPTIHVVLPHIHRLKKICSEEIGDENVIKTLKNVLSHHLQSTILTNLTIFHKIAIFLFPPTNKLTQFTQAEKTETIEKCKTIMKKFSDSTTNYDEPNTIIKSESDENDIFVDFIQPKQDDNLNDHISREINTYMNVNIQLSDDFNLIQWWNLNRFQFPLLYKTSCKILATPATSAASERAFSLVRNLITQNRNSTTTNLENVNKIMFLHCNVDKNNASFLE